MVLLIGFMSLLTAVTLFLFVYASNPVEPPSLITGLPEPVNSALNSTINGWKALISDLGTVNNVTSG